MSYEMNYNPDRNSAYDRLATIADRLGVKPKDKLGPGDVAIRTTDGKYYSIYELVEALLDRMDNVK